MVMQHNVTFMENNESRSGATDGGALVIISVNIVLSTFGSFTNAVALWIFRMGQCQSDSHMRDMLMLLSLTEFIFQMTGLLSNLMQLPLTASPALLEKVRKKLHALRQIGKVLSDSRLVSLTVRNYWIGIIAIRRWDATSKPLRPRFQNRRTRTQMLILLVCLYFLAIVGLVPVYTFVAKDEKNMSKHKCKIFEFWFWYIAASHIMPFLVIVVFGALTICIATRASQYFREHNNNNTQTVSMSLLHRQRAVTRTISTLLVTFLLLEIPFFLITGIIYLEHCKFIKFFFGANVTSWMMRFCYALSDIDSLCNFFIYFVCYTPFRRRLHHYFITSTVMTRTRSHASGLVEHAAREPRAYCTLRQATRPRCRSILGGGNAVAGADATSSNEKRLRKNIDTTGVAAAATHQRMVDEFITTKKEVQRQNTHSSEGRATESDFKQAHVQQAQQPSSVNLICKGKRMSQSSSSGRKAVEVEAQLNHIKDTYM